MITASYDRSAGMVRSQSTGLLTVAEVRKFFGDLKRAAMEAHADAGRIKVLIDSTQSVVQQQEVMEEFERNAPIFDGPQDRTAVVVASSLKKMQIRRTFKTDKQQAFLSESAAVTWLMAN